MFGQASTVSIALSILAAAPALINAHGQLSRVSVGGKDYPAWNLDDHYKAAYKKQGESRATAVFVICDVVVLILLDILLDPQYGEQPQQKYTVSIPDLPSLCPSFDFATTNF